jgi:hypothetical protein
LAAVIAFSFTKAAFLFRNTLSPFPLDSFCVKQIDCVGGTYPTGNKVTRSGDAVPIVGGSGFDKPLQIGEFFSSPLLVLGTKAASGRTRCCYWT